MKDRPSFEFRDQTTPARLCYLMKIGEVTITDLLLIYTIGSLVRPQGDQDGIGCWASNAYLGNAINVHPTYASQRIKYLEDKGLLLVIRVGSQRYLELEWSRTAEEREALAGKYGKVHRAAYKRLIRRLLTADGGDDAFVLGKPKAPPLGKPKANRLEEDRRGAAASRPAHPPSQNSNGHSGRGGSVESNGNGRSNTKKVGLRERSKPMPDEQCRGWAEQLRNARREHNRQVSGTIAGSAEHFRLLRDHDQVANIPAILRYYCDNCRSSAHEESVGLPSITCGKQFRQRFDWLEKAWRGSQKRRNSNRVEEDNVC